ncbi:MAG: Xaa-Pro peptidase family protein [Bacillota bacterium]
MRLQERLNRIASLAAGKGFEAVVLFGRANIRYITDMRWNVAAFSVLLVRPSGEVVYAVPVLDHSVALEECWLGQVGEIRRFPEDTPNYLDVFRGVISPFASEVGVDLESAGASQVEMLGAILGSARLVPVDRDLLAMRAIKDPQEVERLREAARIADAGMEAGVREARRGARERDISLRAKFAMEVEGAEGTSFEPFAMSGPNSWKPRRYSTHRILEDGDLVIFDVGGIYQGYCSDITRTLYVGELEGEKKDLFDLALSAQQAAVASIKPGVVAGDVDRVARTIIADAGYGRFFPHLTGHGVGLDIHEMPILDQGSQTVLQPGMVVTVEPGVYMPGLGGARVEDMVLVTGSGFEVLTRAPRIISV